MSTAEIVVTVILFLLALICLTVSLLQFANKGFCFNNAYIYASEEEREKMDKKPYYRQSGIVFLLIAAINLINGFAVIFHTPWLFYIATAVTAAAVVFAVVSTVKINKNNR